MIRYAATALALLAAAQFTLPPLPVLPGSTIAIAQSGLEPPFDLAVLGPATITSSYLTISAHPTGSAITLIGANRSAVAMGSVAVAPAPDRQKPFIAVASYDDGVMIHDASAPFTKRAVFAVAGSPSDVAIGDGRLASAATNADTASIATIAPWSVSRIANVPFADELAFDQTTHALFVTNRDVDGSGSGALTRIDATGATQRVTLGQTGEGIAIDARRARIYVANVNDGTVSIVDAATMHEIRRVRAVNRVFSLALSDDGTRLYATSNQSMGSPFNAAGSVVALDVASAQPHVVARSAPLTFPLGVAFDGRNHRLFVTDELEDAVDVLDPLTLRAIRGPLHTCRTPWKPLVDDGTLYVPCARADAVDVFDARTLVRAHGAPFATGGYPLSVAVYHGTAR